jgi:phosphoserine phosphatase
MDMDSTLITIECIDEIADRVGIKSRGCGDHRVRDARRDRFHREASTRRVALLAGLPVAELETGLRRARRAFPGRRADAGGFRAAGAKTLLVSGGFTFFTDRLAARLGFDETAANTLEIDAGRLTGRVIPPIVDGRQGARLDAMRKRFAARTASRSRSATAPTTCRC